MSEPKFTPGPWELEYRCQSPEAYSVIKRGVTKNGHAIVSTICHIADGSKYALRNIQLIAAAPDLYRELEELTSLVQNSDSTYWEGVNPDEVVETALAALAKARGE